MAAEGRIETKSVVLHDVNGVPRQVAIYPEFHCRGERMACPVLILDFAAARELYRQLARHLSEWTCDLDDHQLTLRIADGERTLDLHL